MENTVNFQQGMDIDPDDFNNLQSYAKATFDDLVGDAVTAAQRYSGFTVTKTGTTTVSVDVGRLYSGGRIYAQTVPTTRDFITSLPVAGAKICSVVLTGTETDTDVTPREFLINEDTGASQPKPVALTHARTANVAFAEGAEAPTATAPILQAGYTKVADVLLSTTGVASVTMYAPNALPNLDGVGQRTGALETFESAVGPKISTLTSDLAALAGQISAAASADLLGRVLTRLADLEFKDRIPTTAVDSRADYFLSADGIDLHNTLSHVKIEEGLRFPDAAAVDASLQLFNPLDASVTVKNGLMMPAYTRQLWLTSGPYGDQAQIAAYTYTQHQLLQKTMTRQRVRYGSEFSVCTNSAFWQSGTFDPITSIFTLPDGETFKAALDLNGLPYTYTGDGYLHVPVRLQEYWTDNVSETYWDDVSTVQTVAGAQIAETFLQGQDMWLDAVGLYFTKLADTGSAFLSIVEVGDDGIPDLTSCISHTEVPRASMNVYPAETQVTIQPTVLSGGKRYAVLLTTAADHWVATTGGQNFAQGTFFYVLDGAYAQGDGARDLMFNLYRAQFAANRAAVVMNSISLPGGMLSIDILAGTAVPGSTAVTYEIQPSGSGTWYNLADVDTYILGQGGSIPVLCGLRAVLTGSVDLMPAVNLLQSNVHVSRPDTARTALTEPWAFPAPSANVHVIARYENWQAPYHTATAKLMTGTGFNTAVAPSSYTDATGTDELGQNFLERTYVFALPAAVSGAVIRLDATTTTPQVTFHTAWYKAWVL